MISNTKLTTKSNPPSSTLDSSFVQISSSNLTTSPFSDPIKISKKVNSNQNYKLLDQNADHSTVRNKILNDQSFPIQGSHEIFSIFYDRHSLEHLMDVAFEKQSLTIDAINRIRKSIECDTKRLELECHIYDETIRTEQATSESWKDAINRITFSTSSEIYESNATNGNGSRHDMANASDIPKSHVQDKLTMSCIHEAFLSEITELECTIRDQEQQLRVLRSLLKEQLIISHELDNENINIAEKSNFLELEAKAFDSEREILSRNLATAQVELDRVSSPFIRLPTNIFHIQVDKYHLSCPLINELRLAYRQKGDLQHEEIQGAWSLAAQLLLVIGTIFDFKSKYCKIVPLSQCAKLIYYHPESNHGGDKAHINLNRESVYNLGHPKTNAKRALLTLNALMSQMINFIQKKCEDERKKSQMEELLLMPSVPFENSSTSLGSMDLTQLHENDDVNWSKAVHCIASNLSWLSDCASSYVLNDVLAG